MKTLDADARLLYPGDMMCAADEFTVNEATIVAIVQTMNTMSHAITELSRQLEEAAEAMFIMGARLDLLEADAARGPALRA